VTGAPRIRIGISGWSYPGWRGIFYPKGLPQRRELEHAARLFDSIEINGTFYSLQRPASFLAWRRETPDGFVFALKGGRFITHMKRLKGVDQALANFFASGVLALGPKLGPILWQLPERFRFDEERIDAFLRLLPRDTGAAARLAAGHDARLDGRACIVTDAVRPLRHAIEVRHGSFADPAFVALLRRHGVALCVADTPDYLYLEDVTADFVYCRLHGSEQLYASGYDDAALDRWAARLRAWAAGGEPEGAVRVAGAGPAPPAPPGGRDVYVYFDNDAKVRAPFDALGLAKRLAAAPRGARAG
jgi:uncharacterized protein YecE (DUF72 family)